MREQARSKGRSIICTGSRSSDGIQPVELLDAVCKQSSADRFFHEHEGSLCLSRFGFSLLGAELGRDLLIHLSGEIGLSLLERPMGVLELLVYRNHQFAIRPLCALGSYFGLSQFLRSLPTQELCVGLGFACPLLRGAKRFGCLIHQIKSGGRLVWCGRRAGRKLVDIPARKLIRPTPLLLHHQRPDTGTMRHYQAVMVNERLSRASGAGIRVAGDATA